MAIAARIVGGILLLVWLFFIPVGRRFMRAQGQVMHATVFQYNILPFIVGIGLIVSGNLLFLVVIPVAWVLSIFFSSFFLFFFPPVVGWVLGSQFFADIFPDSKSWYWGGGAIGVVVMIIVCSVVTAIVTAPPRHMRPPMDGMM